MLYPCLVCNLTAEHLADLRGQRELENALLQIIPELPTGEHLYTCDRCFVRVSECVQQGPLTLSVADVLRDTADASESYHSSFEIVESHEESGEILNVELPVNTDSLSTQSQPMGPSGAHRPGPKSMKRPREPSQMEEQPARVLSIAEQIANQVKAQSETVHKSTKNGRTRSKTPLQQSVNSTNSLENRSVVTTKVRRMDPPQRPETSLSENNSPPDAISHGYRRPGPRSRVNPAIPPAPRSSVNDSPPPSLPDRPVSNRGTTRVIPSSPDSTPPPPTVRRRHRDDGNSHSNARSRVNPAVPPAPRSSVDDSPPPSLPDRPVSNRGTTRVIPSSPDSTPPPPTVRRRHRDDGNSHSNGAAPRRINVPAPVAPANSRESRDTTTKNLGG